MAVHDRPAAFGGADGFSYSAEILADETGEVERPFGAYLLFVRWSRIGAASPAGHLESAFVAYGKSAPEALQAAGALPLSAAKDLLDQLILAAAGSAPTRRWWDAMRAEDEGGSQGGGSGVGSGDGA